jgi:hypothetical protein
LDRQRREMEEQRREIERIQRDNKHKSLGFD